MSGWACGCPSHDAENCVRMRCGLDFHPSIDEPCGCACHDDLVDYDDEEAR